MAKNYNSSVGYAASPTRPAPMASPASVGQMVASAEQQVYRPSPTARNPYNKSPPPKARGAFETGRKAGERAILGRTMLGTVSSGPKMNGHIAGLIKGLGRANTAAKAANTIAQLVLGRLNKYDHVVNIPPGLTLTWQCPNGGTANCWSNQAGFTGNYCANATAPGPIWKGDKNNYKPWDYIIYLWRDTFVDYSPNTALTMAWPVARYDRSPSSYNPWVTTSAVKTGSVVAVMPMPLGYPQAGEPFGWAQPFSEPATSFPGVTEQGYGGASPATGTVSDYATYPLPSIQTLPAGGTTPHKPVVTPTPTITANRPPRWGKKESKWRTSSLVARLGRLSLHVTEGIDALESIYEGLPEDVRKKCKAAARRRQLDAKREGRQYGAYSRKMMPQETAKCLYDNLDKLDWSDAAMALIENQLEDMWIGFQMGILDKAIRSTGREVLRVPFEPVPLPSLDDNEFWNEVGDYLDSLEERIR